MAQPQPHPTAGAAPGWLELRALRCPRPPEPAPLLVDVAIALDLAPSAASDAYADTVDLAALARLVRATVAAPPRALLETIAVQTAQAILASFDRVTRVQLVVVKPEPAGLRAAAEVVRLDLGRN